ncbi:NADPH:quinone oxidoreductase [Niastella vici]|uniref:NADPH:quinone oxidoreductase n=2 Tax=Niastella vici TaxID=1703345 RepID=A0A1V9GAJ9_9BACT|nr:NADPH:quinone oxidoreductase [Niastella vici]
MKSYHIQYGGGLNGLSLKQHPIPKAGAREVLIKMRANSLSYRDVNILAGNYPLPVKPDVIAVSDGAGEVVATGDGVTRARPGDRVAVNMFPLWLDGPFGWDYAPQIGGSLDGLLTEYAVVHEDAIVPIPDHLTYEEAATLPCAALTAWNALTGGKPLRAGETVLTLGSGSVSLFALQFAKLFGARVIATTSDEVKAQRLKALGASEVINYRQTPEFSKAVRELTQGNGVDQVVEVAGSSMEQSILSTRAGGQVNFIGRMGGESKPVNLTTLFMSAAHIRPIAVGNRSQFIAMNNAIAVNKLKPVIDRVFPFAQAKEAFSYLQTGNYFGKIVITHS